MITYKTSIENYPIDKVNLSLFCKGKVRYNTPYHAQCHIDIIESRSSNKRLGYYKCPYCNNYHLTEK